MNWVNPGGCETGPIVVDPNDRNISYGACYGGEISYVNMATGEYRNVLIYPQLQAGSAGRDLKYRFGWTYPIILSPHDPNVLYVAGNVIFKSTNEGHSFQPISPDLSRQDSTKLEPYKEVVRPSMVLPMGLQDRQAFLLAQLPNIGDDRARALLAEDGTLREVLRRVIAGHLSEVDGFGLGIQRNVNEFLDEEV